MVFLWTNFPIVYLDNMKLVGEKCFRAVEHLAILSYAPVLIICALQYTNFDTLKSNLSAESINDVILLLYHIISSYYYHSFVKT